MQLRSPGSINTPRAAKTRRAQILASKYHFPLKITRASLMVTLEHHIVLDTRSAQGGRTVSKRKKKLSQLEGVLTN